MSQGNTDVTERPALGLAACAEYRSAADGGGVSAEAIFAEACPMRVVLDRVAGKWSVQIIVAAARGPVRFTELERSIEGISRRMLTLTLRNLERDGLLHVAGDRQLALTDSGRALAMRVMRKHRLAECLLVSVIHMPWEEVHVEACRWEHVISESVERRLYELLGHPDRCPRAGRADQRNVLVRPVRAGLPDHVA